MIKRWQKYEHYLLSGDFHVHTSYTDGKNTVFEMCEQAVKNNLKLIAFTEHVRRELNYCFDSFLEDIQRARKYFDLEILSGCEVKVMNINGELDVSSEVLNKCDIVLASFHSFPDVNKQEYIMAIKNMISYNKFVDVWAHPTLLAKRKKLQLNSNDIREIIKYCKDYNVIIEKNLRYNLPSNIFLKTANHFGVKICIGSDAHQTEEVRKL